MTDSQYTKEEVDYRMKIMLEKIMEHNESHSEALARVEKIGETLDVKITYTNGKVKRLTLILVGLGAYVLGISNIDILSVVKLLT